MLDREEQLKISSTGLKIFERQEAKVHPAAASHSLRRCMFQFHLV